MPVISRFPKNFYFGAATAAYQIEGGWNADGKGESIWDRFVHTAGTIKGAMNGDVACDSYHRYHEDIELIQKLGLNSYRFSIAWSRIQPAGHGAIEQRGMDYYRKLIDGLLAANIRPMPTLYHFDLPQALEDAGGWPERDTAERFAEYAATVTSALGDRVDTWATFNEPLIFTRHGYLLGNHAPGKQDQNLYLRATHTVNLAQGLATRAIKATRPSLRVGNVNALSPAIPASNDIADIAAAEAYHAAANLWFVEPILTGYYPDIAYAGDVPLSEMGWRNGDESIMRVGLDWIGVNYYFHTMVRHAIPNKTNFGLPFEIVNVKNLPLTDAGWPINANGLRDILIRIYRDCGKIPLEVTENGCSYLDEPNALGSVPDIRRIDYLYAHLNAVLEALSEGVDVRGYHHWSLMDNFEWAEGFVQKFGLTHVDFRSLNRTIKDSGFSFAHIAQTGQIPKI